jgi:dCTP deaminase
LAHGHADRRRNTQNGVRNFGWNEVSAARVLLPDQGFVGLGLQRDVLHEFGEIGFLGVIQPGLVLAENGLFETHGFDGFGYDVRLGLKFRRMRRDRNALHPKPISPFTPVDEVWHPVEEVREGGRFVIPPHDCVLAETLEVIRVPEDVGVLVLCKSTWARMFLNLNTTPLEPGWQGTVTLELHNQTPRHLEVFAGHGVGQLWFFRGKAPAVPYNKRAAPTYQNQTDPTPARV